MTKRQSKNRKARRGVVKKTRKKTKKEKKAEKGKKKVEKKEAKGKSRKKKNEFVPIDLKLDALTKAYLESLGGKKFSFVVEALAKTDDDERIARMMKVNVSEVRSILNKLHGLGIVKYVKVKDEKTGWYYYKWRLNLDKLLNMKIEKRKKEMFYCRKCGYATDNFEEAFEHDFRCPICNSEMKTKREIVFVEVPTYAEKISRVERVSNSLEGAKVPPSKKI